MLYYILVFDSGSFNAKKALKSLFLCLCKCVFMNVKLCFNKHTQYWTIRELKMSNSWSMQLYFLTILTVLTVCTVHGNAHSTVSEHTIHGILKVHHLFEQPPDTVAPQTKTHITSRNKSYCMPEKSAGHFCCRVLTINRRLIIVFHHVSSHWEVLLFVPSLFNINLLPLTNPFFRYFIKK